MKDPTAQQFRNRIAIESPTETQAADGSVVQTWATHCTCWASVEPLSGNEYFSAQATQANVNIRIWTRYVDTHHVIPKMRVVWGSRTFEIVSVIDYMSKHLFNQLMVTEAP